MPCIHLIQDTGELPTGGDTVRRSTYGKNAIVYEAEAHTFRCWVLSQRLMYTLQVTEHYENPRNVGTIADADGTANVGSPADGEMIKLTLKITDDVIVAAKFRAFGCPTAIASASILTELITGTHIPDALEITAVQLSDALGGLPLDKQRYANTAEKTLKMAIANFLSKKEG